MNHNHDEHAHHAEMQETSVEELELKSWKRKLIGAWIFAVPIALLMFNQRVFGFDTLRGGLRGLWTFYFNMDSLIALGTIIAYLTGIASYFGLVADYSGVSAMIMAIFITGKFIETVAKGRATQEIKKLLEL